MGIRFYCPTGHRLHVKDFLAGKRGICPHCSERFQIPEESEIPRGSPKVQPQSRAAAAAVRTGRRRPSPESSKEASHEVSLQASLQASLPASNEASTEASKAVTGGRSNGAATTLADERSERTLSVSARTSSLGISADPIDEAPDAVWYVRPLSGGQFGPAKGEVMRSWIAEGRVSAEALVWREGWPDWLTAGPVFPSLATPYPGEEPAGTHLRASPQARKSAGKNAGNHTGKSAAKPAMNQPDGSTRPTGNSMLRHGSLSHSSLSHPSLSHPLQPAVEGPATTRPFPVAARPPAKSLATVIVLVLISIGLVTALVFVVAFRG